MFLTRTEMMQKFPNARSVLMAEANEHSAKFFVDEDGNLVASWQHLSGSPTDAVVWDPESQSWD
jgi:hypothetical protein